MQQFLQDALTFVLQYGILIFLGMAAVLLLLTSRKARNPNMQADFRHVLQPTYSPPLASATPVPAGGAAGFAPPPLGPSSVGFQGNWFWSTLLLGILLGAFVLWMLFGYAGDALQRLNTFLTSRPSTPATPATAQPATAGTTNVAQQPQAQTPEQQFGEALRQLAILIPDGEMSRNEKLLAGMNGDFVTVVVPWNRIPDQAQKDDYMKAVNEQLKFLPRSAALLYVTQVTVVGNHQTGRIVGGTAHVAIDYDVSKPGGEEGRSVTFTVPPFLSNANLALTQWARPMIQAELVQVNQQAAGFGTGGYQIPVLPNAPNPHFNIQIPVPQQP